MSRLAGVPPRRPVLAVVAVLLLVSCITLPASAVPVSPSSMPVVTPAVKIPVPAVTVIPNATVPATPPVSPRVSVPAVTLLPRTDAGEGGETAPGRVVTLRVPAGVTPLPDDVTGDTRHGITGEAAEASREGQGASEPFTGGDTAGGGPQVTVDAKSRVSLTPVVTEEPRVTGRGLFADSDEQQQVLRALQAQDPSVRDIRSGDDSVIIEYGRQGTLLGLVPVPYTETVTIGPGGEYRAEVSWWALFTRHEPPGSMTGDAYREKVLDSIGKIRNGTAIRDGT